MPSKRRSKGAYMISAVAEMYGIHPQTLRLYEREGLLKPSRTEGNTRLYSDEDLERLSRILTLTRDLGVNLAGIEVILNIQQAMETMEREYNLLLESLRAELRNREERISRTRSSQALVKAPPARVIPIKKG